MRTKAWRSSGNLQALWLTASVWWHLVFSTSYAPSQSSCLLPTLRTLFQKTLSENKEKEKKKRRRNVKERMKETKYGIKDGVGPDPRKPNFQWTVGSMICDCKAIGNKKKRFSLQYILFWNWNKRRKQMKKGMESEGKMRLRQAGCFIRFLKRWNGFFWLIQRLSSKIRVSAEPEMDKEREDYQCNPTWSKKALRARERLKE